MSLKDIVTAWTSEDPVNEAWYQERLSICNSCPNNSVNKEEKTFLQGMREALGGIFKEPYCTLCGCTIRKKALVKEQQCADTDSPKWLQLATESVNLKGDIFLIEKIDSITDYRISSQLGQQIITLDESAEDLVDFKFKVYVPEGLVYKSHFVECQCTVPKVKIDADGSLLFNVKISQITFPVNTRVSKSMTIHFQEEGQSIKIKFLAKKVKNEL